MPITSPAVPDLENALPALPLSGAFLIDKPVGLTSSDVVVKLKIALTKNGYCERGFKIGHGGTLDPFATGTLIVLVGEATKLADCYLHSRKAYSGVITLGVKTDTGDLTGAVMEGIPETHWQTPKLTLRDWQSFAHSFTQDEYWQTPPMYSAKKQGGIALHTLARQGIEVERKAILKKIDRFEVEPLNETELSFVVECESGTYVRVLAEDLAKVAGTLAHLKTLRRIQSSDFKITDTDTLENSLVQLNEKKNVTELKNFRSLPHVATHLPSFEINAELARQVKQGLAPTLQQLCWEGAREFKSSRYGILRHQQNPVALLERLAASNYRVQRVFNT
jgi:tRNA pseudouridine55 synthase